LLWVLRGMGFRAGYGAVMRWFTKAGEFLLLTIRRRRGYVAVDERAVRSLAGRAYLWAAREIGTGEVIAVTIWGRVRGVHHLPGEA